MKYIFNGNEYIRNGHNNNGLGRLIFAIFKHYLHQNSNKTYSELKEIFNSTHSWGNRVILSDDEYAEWLDSNASERAVQRYFEPVEYNGMNLHFTTQWGDNGGNGNNITNFINFAKNELQYEIEEIEEIDIQDPVPAQIDNKIKNIILCGAPGVGKTHNTKKLISLLESNHQSESNIFSEIEQNILNDGEDANQLVENIKERVKFITFHQSFGYEDFIEGFRPNENGNIKLRDGVFKTICDAARNDKENKHFLVIDEINRGNISKIFGELITLIEEDKRDSLHVTLPYSKKEFSIPSNLYIIGTMNSTDKSIALIDIALRRRFTFIKMKPNKNLILDSRAAKKLFETLNDFIESTLGEDYQIGHSYFMNIKTKEDLDFTCKYKIAPLLEEYFYGDSRLEEALQILHSVDENRDNEPTE